MSQINDVVIITGSEEQAAIASLAPHLTVTYNSGAEYGRHLERVSDGKDFGGDKVSGTHVYGACLNYGPLPDEWGEMLDAAPWRGRWSVTAVFSFEMFDAHIWTGQAGWVMKDGKAVPARELTAVRHQSERDAARRARR